MYCGNCGNKVDDDAVFCTKCGIKFSQKNSPNVKNAKINTKKFKASKKSF